MKLTGFPFLVASSLLWAAVSSAATRPHYGGTLRVEMRAAPTSLDPADSNQLSGFGSRNLFDLLFDTLVSLDEQGRVEPALATSWQAEPGNQRWHFFLRHGITFQDGTPVTPDAVATSLRRTNPTWKVFSEGEAVVVERDSPAPNLSDELALARNSIVKRDRARLLALELLQSRGGSRGRNFRWPPATTIGAGAPFSMRSKLTWGKAFASR